MDGWVLSVKIDADFLWMALFYKNIPSQQVSGFMGA